MDEVEVALYISVVVAAIYRCGRRICIMALAMSQSVTMSVCQFIELCGSAQEHRLVLFIRCLCGQQQAPAGHEPIVLDHARHGVPPWLSQHS
jgi:hypothetical protein